MANVIQFTITAVDKGSPKLGKFGKTVGTVAKTALKMSAGIAAAGAATVLFTRHVAEGEDRVAKFAKRLGLAVDQLSAYQFVASQSGIQTEQFNMAVQRMARRVGEAAQGMGEARGALNELGINADEFARKGLDEQLGILADRMGNVESSADKLRLAFKLFDSEGVSMLQMLNQGSAEMQALAKDAQFLGLVISKQAAANAEHFTDSMGRATGSLTGMSRAIGDQLIPIISGLANRFADFVASNRTGIADFTKRAIEGFVTFAVVVGQVIDQLSRYLSDFFSFLADFGSLKGFIGNMESVFDGLSNLIAGAFQWFVQLGERINDVFQEVGPDLVNVLSVSMRAAVSSMMEIAHQGGFVIGKALRNAIMGKEVGDIGQQLSQVLSRAIETANATIESEAGGSIDVVLGELERNGLKAVETVNAVASGLMSTLGINMEEARARARELIASVSEFGEVAAGEGEAAVERMRTIGEELQLLATEQLTNIGTLQKEIAAGLFEHLMAGTEAISAAFAQAIVEGQSLGKALEQIGKQALASLIQMLIKVGLQRVVLAGITASTETAQAGAELGTGIATAGVNAFASTAAIPIVGPILAPAAAAAAIAGASGAAATGLAAGKGIAAGGIAHGGLTSVPRESTFLLDKGERVLSPSQNADLTRFLEGAQGGGRGEGGTVGVFEARGMSGMGSMPLEEVREFGYRLAEAFGGKVMFTKGRRR